MRSLSLVAGAVVVVTLSLNAAQSLSDSTDGAGPQTRVRRTLDLEANMLRSQLPQELSAYGAVDGYRMKAWVSELVAISGQSRDDGERYWGRIAGTKYSAMAAQWAEQKFRGLGLEGVRLQEIALRPQWFPSSWHVTATGSGRTLTPLSAYPARGTMATPPEGLDLEAVWVGLGTEADYIGRDVAGKLVAMHSWPTDAPHGHSAAWLGAMQRAATKGAAALLVTRATPGNFQVIGHNSPITTFWLGNDDGNALRDLIAEGPVKVRLRLETELRQGLKDYNTWGTLPGTSEEEIFIKAHHDGYFDGAMDNASGVATVVALAEYFARIPREQRRRTITFLSLAAHHGGGDWEWVNDPLHPVREDAALLINCEHTAVVSTMTFGDRLRRTTSIDPRRWTVMGSDQLSALTVAAFTRFGVTLYEDMEGPPNAGTSASAPARRRPNMPSINLIHSPQRFYHSDNDKADHIPAHGLEAVARAFAKIVDDVNALPRTALTASAHTSTLAR